MNNEYLDYVDYTAHKCIFEDGGKEYTYLGRKAYVTGSLVVVENRKGPQVVKVMWVGGELKDNIDYKWIVDEVETADHDLLMARIRMGKAALAQARRSAARKNELESIGLTEDDVREMFS